MKRFTFDSRIFRNVSILKSFGFISTDIAISLEKVHYVVFRNPDCHFVDSRVLRALRPMPGITTLVVPAKFCGFLTSLLVIYAPMSKSEISKL